MLSEAITHGPGPGPAGLTQPCMAPKAFQILPVTRGQATRWERGADT